MPLTTDPLGHSRRNVRLNTLITLRWLSVAGQTAAVVAVHFLFDTELPLTACLSVIALSAWLNIALRMNYRYVQRLEPARVAWLLAYDIGQLSVLVYLTGGLENPFAFLILAPVLISAMALPLRLTLALGLFAIACSTVIAVTYFDVPFTGYPVFAAPSRYLIAIWVADLVAIVFIGTYAWQIAEEGRLLADALAATEMVLMREQHLSQLDGLAAAAAHELGTPLATIAVIAKELERALGPASPHNADMKLLREQTQRCRDILAKLTALSPDGAPYDRPKLSALIDEVIAPHRNFGIAIDVVLPPDLAGEPTTVRSPAILYGLGNLVENAVDFANDRVEIAVRWNEQEVAVTISDDGPGFSPEVRARIGEPYVTSRRREAAEDQESGLGLGFFIAKTLLERSGATVDFVNRPAPEKGAVVRVRWPRGDFDRLLEDAEPQAAPLEPKSTPA